MIFQLNNYILEVDVELTRTLYGRPDVPTISEEWSSIKSLNFEKAIMNVPDSVLAFLKSLGIDPRKPAYVFNSTRKMEEHGTLCYTGWYHVCGHFVEIPETSQEMAFCNDLRQIISPWEQSYTPDPDFPFTVLPVEEITMLHKVFPSSVVQLQFDTCLPWVLDIPFES